MGYLMILMVLIGLVAWIALRPRPGQSVSSLGNRHIEKIGDSHEPYNSKPPTSGPHVGTIATWGVHTEQIPDELQVHNLEDGGVILHYDPDRVDTGTLGALTSLVKRYPDKVILEPYAGMDAPMVLTAWTKIDKLEGFNKARIKAFINAYRGIDHHVPGEG